MSVSTTDAAFEGFRIARERPVAMAAWALVQFATSFCIYVAATLTIGPQMASFTDPAFLMNPASLEAAAPKLFAFYAAVSPPILIGLALLQTAAMRSVLRPDEKGLGFLALGFDEARQSALIALTVGLVFAAILLLTVGVSVVAGFLAGVGAGVLGGLIGTLMMLAGVVAIIWAWLRLSLAPAITFATRRIRLFDSWALTRGRLGRLIGVYLLAFALSLVVTLLGFVIAAAVTALVSRLGEAVGLANSGPFSSLASLVTPGFLSQLAVGSVFSALSFAITWTPGAFLYREFAGQTRLKAV